MLQAYTIRPSLNRNPDTSQSSIMSCQRRRRRWIKGRQILEELFDIVVGVNTFDESVRLLRDRRLHIVLGTFSSSKLTRLRV